MVQKARFQASFLKKKFVLYFTIILFIVVLGVAIGVLVLNACVLSVDISVLVYNRILAVDIAVLRRQKKGSSTGDPEYAGERRDDRGGLGMRGRTLV